MHWEICVAHDKQGHVFATHPRSLTSEHKAREVFALLRSKFPQSEGYNVMVSYHEGSGLYLDWEGAHVPR